MSQLDFLHTPPVPDQPPPHVRGSATSQAAAEKLRPIVGEMERKVYQAIVDAGENGLTDEELTVKTGLRESTARARRVELWQAGYIADSGGSREFDSGRKGTVWIAAAISNPPSPSHLVTPLPIARSVRPGRFARRSGDFRRARAAVYVHAHAPPATNSPIPSASSAPSAVNPSPTRCPRCGGPTIDVRIHGGRSVRRDCKGCHRFVSFPVWYEENHESTKGRNRESL